MNSCHHEKCKDAHGLVKMMWLCHTCLCYGEAHVECPQLLHLMRMPPLQRAHVLAALRLSMCVAHSVIDFRCRSVLDLSAIRFCSQCHTVTSCHHREWAQSRRLIRMMWLCETCLFQQDINVEHHNVLT